MNTPTIEVYVKHRNGHVMVLSCSTQLLNHYTVLNSGYRDCRNANPVFECIELLIVNRPLG